MKGDGHMYVGVSGKVYDVHSSANFKPGEGSARPRARPLRGDASLSAPNSSGVLLRRRTSRSRTA